MVRTRHVFSRLLLGLSLFNAAAVHAQEVELMKGITPRADDARMTMPNQYKRKGPWKIGMSHFGLSNTWSIQMAHEAEFDAAANKNISQFQFRNADLNPIKQAADIDDLIAQNVDALVITPLTPTVARTGIEKAAAAGIPVIVHTGLTDGDAYAVDIQGGGEYFGRVIGEWIIRELKGKGNIWVLRGVYSHPEDISRYNGLVAALAGSNVQIVAEDYANWDYEASKRVCENFYLTRPDVQAIWSSGADMSRGCIEVFKDFGAKIPPISGEGNNGFFKIWRSNNLRSIAPEYGPEQGAAGVRAAVALLEGKPLHKRYIYNPRPFTSESIGNNVRIDLNDSYWFPSSLPEASKAKLYNLNE